MESLKSQYDSLSERPSSFLVQGITRPSNPPGFLSSPVHPGWNASGSRPSSNRLEVPAKDSSNTHLPPCTGLPAEPAKKGRAVEVVCGPVKGVFLIDEQAVLLQDKVSGTIKVSPTEMERLGGKESNKKWKSTLRVLDSKGQVGKPVGEWLRLQGIELVVQRKQRAKRNRSSLSSVSAVHVNLLNEDHSYESAYKSNELRARIEMGLHLETCHLGHRPCDPESSEVPAGFPSVERKPNFQEVNMKELSNDQLLVLSKATERPGQSAKDTLLPNPPGVLVGHEAYVTGREPKRKQIPRAHAGSTLLVEKYLNGQLSLPPLKAFGIDRLPKLGDRDVNLRELYFLVQESGGFDIINLTRKWPEVADKMRLNSGLTMSRGYGLRSIYERFLLKFESKEQSPVGNDVSVNEISGGSGSESTNSKGSNDSQNQGCTSREDDDLNDPMFQCSLSCSSLSSQKDCFGTDENHTADTLF